MPATRSIGQRLWETYRSLSRPHQALPLAFAVVLAGLASPWIRGEPFAVMHDADPVTLTGFSAAPPLALVLLIGAVGLFARNPMGRAASLLVTFGTVTAWTVAGLTAGFHLGCFMCSDVELLIGVPIAAAGGSLGLGLTLLGLDPAALREELGLDPA